MMSLPVSITYVPADCGSVIPGKSKAPEAFREVGIAKLLDDQGLGPIREHQALQEKARYSAAPSTENVRNFSLNVSVCAQVRNSLADTLDSADQDTFHLILGGECCMLPGVMDAFWGRAEDLPQPERVGLVYIDADTDLATPTDPDFTGTFASMNMTNLTQPFANEPLGMGRFARLDDSPLCDSSNTVFFGTNMSSPSNKREHFGYLFDNNFKVVTSSAVAADPVNRAKEVLEHMKGVDNIIVHLDVDAIDPRTFPLANVPNYTGVSYEQMMQALRIFLHSPHVCALTVAEVNPDHDPGLRMTERLATDIASMLKR